MDLGIKGKRVLVTGASQGVGKEIALAFAAEGCKVAAIARREGPLKALIEEMGGLKQGHTYVCADLMEEGRPAAAVKDLIARGGDIEIVVHNVGGTLKIKDPLAAAKEWARVWRFNVGVAIEINNVVVPKMQANKWGRIIHISSVASQDFRGSPAYAASKAYLNAYTKVAGRAFAPDGIVVSALMLGAFYAKGGHWDEDNYTGEEEKEAFLRKRSDFLRHHHAIGRLGKAEEIAPFALFMASQQASFAAASLIPVDGGTM